MTKAEQEEVIFNVKRYAAWCIEQAVLDALKYINDTHRIEYAETFLDRIKVLIGYNEST